MRVPKSLRIFVALCLAALSVASQGRLGIIRAAANPVPVRADFDGLFAKAQSDGRVRVIVGQELPQPFQVEGSLTTWEAQGQRGAIAAAHQALLESLSGYDVTVHAAYEVIPYMALEVDEAALRALFVSSRVSSIQEDEAVPATLASSIPVIAADDVWAVGVDGTGWTVAVLDTGVQWDHEFFGGSASSRVVSEACYSSDNPAAGIVTLCPNGLTLMESGHAADPTVAACDDGGTSLCSHGTHVAGIAVGNGTAYDGVAPGANIVAIQVFTRFNNDSDCGGTGTAPCVLTYSSDQISGLQRVYNLRLTYDIAAVNMSLGGGAYTSACDGDPRKAMIDTLRSAGIATVIASGNNSYTNAISAPACISTAVAVGATTDSDMVAAFSNSSNLVDLLAPGVAIDSSVPGNTYASKQGTSMATPHVAGAWALLKSADPTAGVDEILSALGDTGTSVTDTRNGVTKPRIQVDAAAAVLNAATWSGNSTAWNSADNWSRNAVPNRIVDVTIPASPVGGSFPALNADADIHDVTVESGAQLDLGAHTLSVYGDWLAQGSDAFHGTGSTVTFRGRHDQSIGVASGVGDPFYHLQIGDGSRAQSVALTSDLGMDGNLTVIAGASLAAGSNTIHVAGNWTDDGPGFLWDTSTVVMDGSDQSAYRNQNKVVLLEDFAERDSGADGVFYFTPPSGWAVTNEGQSYPWLFGYSSRAPNSPDTGGHARHLYNGQDSNTTDTWLLTPGLDLDSDLTYRLEFSYGARYSFRPESLQVQIGTGQTSGEMTTELYVNTNITNNSWSTAAVTFTVPSAGTYYLGFRCYTAAPHGEFAMDDISLTEISDYSFYNLAVNTTGSGVAFDDNVKVIHDLTIGSGATMNVGTHKITSIGGSFTNNGTLRNQESHPVTATSGTQMFLDARSNDAAQITYNSGSEPGNTTVATYVGSTIADDAFGSGCSSGSNTVSRYYNIVADLSAGLGVTLRLYYGDAELNGNTEASLRIWHCEGGSWIDQGGTVNTAGNYVETTVSSLSPFVLSENAPTPPTAVDLARFEATAGRLAILVEWETTSENDVLGFNLFRADAPEAPLMRLNDEILPCLAPGSPAGDTYRFLDVTADAGRVYYYWLESVDLYGGTMRFGPIAATIPPGPSFQIYLPSVKH